MSAGAAGGAAAAAAIIQAIKASGVIVNVEPNEFLGILQRQQGPLVVHATGGFFSTNYKYLTSYKGLAFFTKAAAPLNLPSGTELVQAKSIWVPGGVTPKRCGRPQPKSVSGGRESGAQGLDVAPAARENGG